MNEAKLMNGLNGQNALRNIESGNVFGESVVFDKHGHEVASGKEFHYQVEELRVLEGVEKLHDPWRVGFSQYVSFSTHVSKLPEMLVSILLYRTRTNLILLQHLLLLPVLANVSVY